MIFFYSNFSSCECLLLLSVVIIVLLRVLTLQKALQLQSSAWIQSDAVICSPSTFTAIFNVIDVSSRLYIGPFSDADSPFSLAPLHAIPVFSLSFLCLYFLSASCGQSQSVLLVPGSSLHCNQTPGISSRPTLAGRRGADKTPWLLLRPLQCCSFGRSPLLRALDSDGFAKEKSNESESTSTGTH